MTDVVVVGASAAGLFAAGRLAKAGAGVRVLERSQRLPPAARTLIATHRLRDVLGPLTERTIVNEIKAFELFADGRVASVALREPDLVVERATLIRDLADDAMQAGADVALGHRFVGFKGNGGGMEVVAARPGADHKRIHASKLIGADGASSRVARAAGWSPQPTVPLVQAVVRCPDGLPSDTVRVWFRPDETRYFYWLIPEGDGRGVLGLIGHERHDARRLLDGFLSEKKFAATEYQAARIPLYTRWRPVRQGDVYLVGDAAGHVKPSTVGGLVTGFKGAAGVADQILGLPPGELHALRRELGRHSLVRRVLARFGEPDYKRLLDLIRSPEHQLLGSHSRDDTHRLLWRLCLREPRLAMLAAIRLLSAENPPS